MIGRCRELLGKNHVIWERKWENDLKDIPSTYKIVQYPNKITKSVIKALKYLVLFFYIFHTATLY